jgi:hypothetical protein
VQERACEEARAQCVAHHRLLLFLSSVISNRRTVATAERNGSVSAQRSEVQHNLAPVQEHEASP